MAVQSPKVPLTDYQARLQATLLDNVKAAIIATDMAGTIIYWNPFAEELYGWSSQEVVGRNIMGVTVSAQTEVQARETMSTLTAGRSWAGEFEVRRKNGTTFTAFINLSPIADERGVLIGVVGVSQDLTEHKQAEEAVRRSEELFRTLANSLPNLCFMAHPDGHVFWYNQRFYEYTGTTPEQITGWGWQCLHDPAMLPSILARWRTSLETGQPFEMEFPLRGAGGTFRWFLTRIRPVRDSQGKIVRWFGANSDIQEQREVRQALTEGQQELEKRVQARTAELNSATESLRELSGRLLQIQDDERRRIARDLHDSAGQLLAALSMNIDTVRTESDKLSPAAAAAAAENARMVEEITKEIRTISYLLHPPLLDEVGLASALSWYIKGFSERSKIDVTLELPPDFGRLSKEKEISIFRIVQECLTNIHRHSESATAAVRFIQHDNRVQVEIKDAGKGIPVERQRALSAHSGSGVGFRGMRERLRQVGGTLEIESSTNGTIVTATLPTGSTAPNPRSVDFKS
jgi:PAS domain S-box-containing protein